MSAHPAPRATRAIRVETAGSSGLALGPNQRGKAGGEVEASIPVMAMAHQRTGGRVAGEPILLDAGRSCHACAGRGRGAWVLVCSHTPSRSPIWYQQVAF